MKVLVTGGAGFIGSHVVDAFLAAGHEVVVVDDLSTGRERNLNPQARFYKLDIRDPGLAEVFERERPEIVDHHAAQMDVRRSVAEPLFDADVNVRGSVNLLECARQSGVRKVVYISTGGAVYGEPVYLPCDEKHPIDPICQYGVSKHVVEHYLHVYRHLYGLNYAVLRYPNVYGPRQDPHGEAGVVAIFTGLMLAGKPVTINGTGEQERDFVYVADCAKANLLAAAGDQTGIYNLGEERGTTVNQLFRELAKITGYTAAPQYGPPKPGETFKIYLNSQKAKAELDWSQSVDLETGLSQTVEYFKQFEQA
ncbi:MAG: NAD-dependent epimerase/dehydratase family protein [Anaerolineales bacterium]|nr:NAD-dependent epimerase/dehydratase family protein [Anaerolineales bacterium]